MDFLAPFPNKNYNLGSQESVIGKEGKNIMKQKSLLCRRVETKTFIFETPKSAAGNCALFRKISHCLKYLSKEEYQNILAPHVRQKDFLF